jgi:hypothetical protein
MAFYSQHKGIFVSPILFPPIYLSVPQGKYFELYGKLKRNKLKRNKLKKIN